MSQYSVGKVSTCFYVKLFFLLLRFTQSENLLQMPCLLLDDLDLTHTDGQIACPEKIITNHIKGENSAHTTVVQRTVM